MCVQWKRGYLGLIFVWMIEKPPWVSYYQGERLADWCNIVEWPVPSKLQDNVKTEHLNELRITGVVTFYFITEKIRNS